MDWGLMEWIAFDMCICITRSMNYVKFALPLVLWSGMILSVQPASERLCRGNYSCMAISVVGY